MQKTESQLGNEAVVHVGLRVLLPTNTSNREGRLQRFRMELPTPLCVGDTVTTAGVRYTSKT